MNPNRAASWGRDVRSETAVTMPLSAWWTAALFVRIPGYTLLPIGFLLSPLFIAAWARRVAILSRLSAWLLWSSLLALLLGIALRARSAGLGTASVSSVGQELDLYGWLLAFPAAVCLGARLRPYGARRVLVPILVGASLASANLALHWKGDLGIALTALLLASVRGISFQRLVLIGSAAMSAASDARGQAVFAGVALAVTFLPVARDSNVTRGRIKALTWSLAALVLISLIFPLVAQSGLLGAKIRARTQQQLAAGISLGHIRPEFIAGWEVMRPHAWGMGAGVEAPPLDVARALGQVRLAGQDYQSPYWFQDVFAQRVDLHSAALDLWYHFGIFGLCLAAMIAIMLIRLLMGGIALPERRAMFVFISTAALWDLFFSPMASSWRILLALCAASLIEPALSAPRIRWLSAPSEDLGVMTGHVGEDLVTTRSEG